VILDPIIRKTYVSEFKIIFHIFTIYIPSTTWLILLKVTPPAAPPFPVADVITSFTFFNEKKANNNFPEKNEVFYHIRYITHTK
jgi:hypothetical protein